MEEQFLKQQHPGIHALCFCIFVASIVIASISAGGWAMVFKAGTSPERCTPQPRNPESYSQELFTRVCLDGGTEVAGTSSLDSLYNVSGVFRCACCGRPLFPPGSKFDSGTGWPSFWAPVAGDRIGYSKDVLQLFSTEVHCKHCG